MGKKKPNPLRWIWNTLGTIGGVLSISNMAQTWKGDLFAWKGFIADILLSYREVIEPISLFLFGWLPWDIWVWLGDYIIVGIIVSSAFSRSLSGYSINLNMKSRSIQVSEKDTSLLEEVLDAIPLIPLWPVAIVGLLFTQLALIRVARLQPHQKWDERRGAVDKKTGRRVKFGLIKGKAFLPQEATSWASKTDLLALQWLGVILLIVFLLFSINTIL